MYAQTVCIFNCIFKVHMLYTLYIYCIYMCVTCSGQLLGTPPIWPWYSHVCVCVVSSMWHWCLMYTCHICVCIYSSNYIHTQLDSGWKYICVSFQIRLQADATLPVAQRRNYTGWIRVYICIHTDLWMYVLVLSMYICMVVRTCVMYVYMRMFALPYTGVVDALTRIVKNEGVLGLWRVYTYIHMRLCVHVWMDIYRYMHIRMCSLCVRVRLPLWHEPCL